MSRTTYLQEPGKSRRPPAFPSLTWEMSMTKKGNTRRYIMVHHGSSWYIHVYWVYWILQTTHFVNQSEKSHWNSHDWLFWYFFCLVNSFYYCTSPIVQWQSSSEASGCSGVHVGVEGMSASWGPKEASGSMLAYQCLWQWKMGELNMIEQQNQHL